MRFAFAAFILIILASCTPSATTKKLSGSDSLVIHFTAPNSDAIIRSVATTEKKAINRIIDFVDAKPVEEFKCGYDGNILFYEKGNIVSDVSFKYSDPACRHFLLATDKKLTSTKMSEEAADFLESLSEGRTWY